MLTNLQIVRTPLQPLQKGGFSPPSPLGKTPSEASSYIHSSLATTRWHLSTLLQWIPSQATCSFFCVCVVFFSSPFFRICSSASTSSCKKLFQCAHCRERLQPRKHPGCSPSGPEGRSRPNHCSHIRLLTSTLAEDIKVVSRSWILIWIFFSPVLLKIPQSQTPLK